MITSSHPRLPALFIKAQTLGLDFICLEEAGTYLVDSSRPTHPPHYLTVKDDEYQCDCEASLQTEPLACMHVATVAASREPVTCFLKWFTDECRAESEFNYRVRTGQLSRSDRLKLGRRMKVYEARREAIAA